MAPSNRIALEVFPHDLLGHHWAWILPRSSPVPTAWTNRAKSILLADQLGPAAIDDSMITLLFAIEQGFPTPYL